MMQHKSLTIKSEILYSNFHEDKGLVRNWTIFQESKNVTFEIYQCCKSYERSSCGLDVSISVDDT